MLTDRISKWLRSGSTGSSTSTHQESTIVLSTDTGLTRLENQDRVAMLRINASVNSSPFIVVALADGMGGMSEGSECAVKSLATFFNAVIKLRNHPPLDMMRLASLEANMAVFEFAKSSGGATLSAVFISENGFSLSLNIGDSRIYGVRNLSKNKEIVRLTIDDNLEEAVGGIGTELLQFCGMGNGLNPHIAPIPNDINRLIITSDGVHFINKEVFKDIVLNTDLILETSKQLLTYTRWRGSPDNASLAIIDINNIFNNEKDQVSGIKLTNPFSVLELGWIRQELPESFIFNSHLKVSTDSEEIKNEDKTTIKKRKRSNPLKKKIINKSPEDQLSIKINYTPISAELINGKENESK